MGVMGTADVTYTSVTAASVGSPSVPMREYQFLLTFPNASNVLYPTGGVPLVAAQLGCPAYLEKFILLDDGSSAGYVAKWDQKADAIRLYQLAINSTISGSPTTISITQALTELTTASTVTSVTLRALAQGW